MYTFMCRASESENDLLSWLTLYAVLSDSPPGFGTIGEHVCMLDIEYCGKLCVLYSVFSVCCDMDPPRSEIKNY